VKRFYMVAASVLVLVFLVVLLVPGVAESIEGRLLSWLARTAS